MSKRTSRRLVGATGLVCTGAWLSGVLWTPADAAAPPSIMVQSLAPVLAVGVTSWADIVERVSPAVVSLSNEKGLGSGFVVDASGYIVTNNHVMSGLNEAEVRFSDGSKYKARLIGRDEATDIALLKVDAAKSLPSLKFYDDRRVRVGDLVLAVGNPFGLAGTATAGILSARGRDDAPGGQYTDYLQLDAAINPGNSGGPTFDVNGRVIGMNTMGRPGSGIGFAIPASTIQRVIEDLKQGRAVQRGFLGVQIDALSDEAANTLGLPNASGALVTSIIPGSPAEKAGIRRGDVILKINGDVVKDNKELARRIGALKVGETASFTLWRDGTTMTVKVVAGKREAAVAQGPGQGYQLTSLGLALQSITDTVREDFRLRRDARGVLVMGVDPLSDAGSRGLNPGDRIVAIGGVEVSSLADVNLALEKAKAGNRDSILLFTESLTGEAAQKVVKLQKK